MSREIVHSKGARPVIMGRHGAISSGHPLASIAGLRVLRERGNAVDAALAAALTMAVVKPDTCGPGGDLFALAYLKKSGRVEALNASGAAPRKATIEWFREKGLDRIPTDGPLSVAVPGAVDGWTELHRKYGTMDLERLAAEAITHAREGFPLPAYLAENIDELSSYPWIERCYRRRLADLRPGRLLVQKELGETLERIAKKGRDGFYRGELAGRISAALRAEGGLMAEDDLEGNRAEWLEPLSATYRGYLLYEQPPVSQGFMVLEMLNIVEGYDLEKMDQAEVIHVMVEAKKLAFEDRVSHLEDPRFGDPQVPRLISKEHAAERRALISAAARFRARAAGGLASDTTYLCVADRDGNAVSLIQSIFAPFGSRVIAGDTGVIMNNRLSSFVLDAGKANALKPGKRPAHTLNTYMVFRDGEFFAVGGTPGADDQPQTNVQVLHHLIDRRMDPQTAIEMPRWSHSPGTPPRHEGPEELRMEEGFPPETCRSLEKKGHKVSAAERWSFGSAKAIVKDPVSGAWMAGADPRREAYALGW